MTATFADSIEDFQTVAGFLSGNAGMKINNGRQISAAQAVFCHVCFNTPLNNSDFVLFQIKV